MGIVPQDSLCSGTVADNISLNDPQATTETIIESARIACAPVFIMTLLTVTQHRYKKVQIFRVVSVSELQSRAQW